MNYSLNFKNKYRVSNAQGIRIYQFLKNQPTTTASDIQAPISGYSLTINNNMTSSNYQTKRILNYLKNRYETLTQGEKDAYHQAIIHLFSYQINTYGFQHLY